MVGIKTKRCSCGWEVISFSNLVNKKEYAIHKAECKVAFKVRLYGGKVVITKFVSV
jgi:hypothetical protein